MQKFIHNVHVSIVVAVVALCFLGQTPVFAAGDPIAKAYAQKKISDTDYLFYEIQSAFSPEKLPAKYKVYGAPEKRADLTWLILQARKNWSRFTLEQQNYLKLVLARPTDAGDSAAYTTAEATPYCSTNFCIHYVTTTTDAPTDLTDANANGTPDYVENMAQEFETSYTTIITNLGYSYNGITDGTKGGNSKVDVYIKQLQAGYLGFATSEDTASTNPLRMTSYITMANSYSSDNIRKVTAAHEFKHTTDMANYASAPFWWFESTGPWAEDEVYDSINDYAGYISCWLLYPEVYLDNNETDTFPNETRNGTNCGTGGNATLHVYGDTIFIRYLTLKYGTAIEKNLWTQQGTSCSTTSGGNNLDSKKCTADTLDTYLQTNHSATLAAAFADFAVKNYKILSNNFYGPGDGSAKYETNTELTLWFSGNNASNIYVEATHTSFPVSTQTKTLNHMAARYVQFTAPDTSNNVLTITFNGPDSKSFAAKIVLETSAGALTEDAITLDSTTNDGTYAKAGFGSAYNKIILIPVNTGKITTDGSTDALQFTYSASTAAYSAPFAKPGAPSGVTATAGDSKITLSWTAPTKTTYDVSSYNVYRSITTGTGYSKINSSAVTTTSYTDSTVTNGTAYFYVVTAVDSQNNESANSSEVNATPAAATTTTTTTSISSAAQTTLTTQVPEGSSIALIDPAAPSATVTLAGKVNPNNPGGAKFAPAVIQIDVEVYALNGNRVASATTTTDAAGFYVLTITNDFNGKPLANGIYACRTVIRADGTVVKQSMSKIVVYR